MAQTHATHTHTETDTEQHTHAHRESHFIKTSDASLGYCLSLTGHAQKDR